MARTIHALAGQRPAANTLITREQMKLRYNLPQGSLSQIENGTSGYRGSTGPKFSDLHVASITQALADIRIKEGTFGPDLSQSLLKRFTKSPMGPIVIGKDVRFTSDFAQKTAIEVFAGNGMRVIVHKGNHSTPTPVVSHQILTNNYEGRNMEGIVITASHNPPDQAGYKSNGLNAGPNTLTKPIDKAANRYMSNPSKIKRMDYDEAVRRGLVTELDLITPYVEDLKNVVRMDVIRGTKFGASPLGGSANGYYEAINAIHNTNIEVLLGNPDPAGANRTYDWDGKLRGDPSSEYVMMALSGLLQKHNLPFIGTNDNDADRFGGEDSTGILNPNHVLCVLFDYLAKERGFDAGMGLGRTIGTTHMLDLIAADHNRPLVKEADVGFKHYVDGLLKMAYILAGEESAGLSLPRLNGMPWVTEKDGIAAVLLMMEVIAKTGMDIGTYYAKNLVSKYGPFSYDRIDTDATAAKKARLEFLADHPEEVEKLLLGKKIAGRSIKRLAIGDGVKVVLEGGIWVLKRASGTEDIIKDYREERGDDLKNAEKASEEIDHYLELEAA